MGHGNADETALLAFIRAAIIETEECGRHVILPSALLNRSKSVHLQPWGSVRNGHPNRNTAALLENHGATPFATSIPLLCKSDKLASPSMLF
jgi:hypothetical protein